TEVGGPYLLDRLPELKLRSIDELVTTAVVEGNNGSRQVIRDAGRAIGTAAAMLCNVINPRRIVLGGELAGAGELLLDPIRQVLHRRTLPVLAQLVEVRCGELGGEAVLTGALATVVRDLDPVFTS